MRVISILLSLVLFCSPVCYSDASRNFNGTDQWIAIGSFDLSGNELTLLAWFNTDDNTTCGGRMISKANDIFEGTHWWMLSVCNDDLRMRIKAVTTTDTLVDTGNLIAENTWIHGAAVYDGTTMFLYQDGVEIAQGAHSLGGSIGTNAARLVTIGRNGSDTATVNFFEGELMDVRIYDRALTVDEINEAMLCRNSNFNTLEAAYTLMGDDFSDYSGSGNDGTNNSTTSSLEHTATSWCGGSS